MKSTQTFRAGAFYRRISLHDERIGTDELGSTGKGKAAVSGAEFRLCVGEDSRTISSDDYRSTKLADGLYRCDGAAGAPTLQLQYICDQKLGVIRKRVKLINSSDKPILVRWVEVESCKVADPVTYAVSPGFPALGDWGQPVYTKRFFFGVEFPAARNTAFPDGTLQMREYCGITLMPGESWESHPSVFGGAVRGTVEAAFMNYIAHISACWPNVPRPNIYWDGFRVILPPDRTTQGVKMIELAKQMKRDTGFEFDAWTYDAGFDMYRADGLWLPVEPDIWKRTREALQGMTTRLGFWTSFSCIYDTPTHAWGKTMGYGLQHDAAYCLAEPKYAHDMEERLSAIVRENDMRSINFDGMYWGQGFGCNTPGHSHMVGSGAEIGVYGTYAVVVNKMRIFERLRREKPDICLDLFVCNEWASPWWLTVLDGVHTVPGDTVAAGIPSPYLRDDLITVRDIQTWDLHKRLKRQFPLWGEDLYGSQVRADHLIDGIEVIGEAMSARWEDELVMSLVARGPLGAYIVCSDLNVFTSTKSGLRFLGEVGNWVRKNPQPFKHFALLGGDPAKQECFGYAHGDGQGRAVVGIRNPSIRTQTFSLSITKDFNLGKPGPYQVTIVYPYRYTWKNVEEGKTLRIPLADFEVAILEVRAPSRAIPELPEGRWMEREEVIWCAGVDHEPAKPVIKLTIPDPAIPEISGTITIPIAVKAELQLAVNPPAGTKKLSAKTTVDGIETPAQVHFRNRSGSEDGWVLLDLPEGKHEVNIRLDSGSPTRLEAWIQYRQTLSFSQTKFNSSDGLLPTLNPEEMRRTCVALTMMVTGLGSMPSGVVYLGDLKGRCVRSETGWGVIGWNQSCWKDDPTLRLGTKTYTHGLGAHSPSRFDFMLDGGNRVLRAGIGVHPIPLARRQPGWPKGSACFYVVGDGKTLYKSPVLRETDGPRTISVPLKGVRLLSLVTDDGGDGIFDDLCNWGNVRLE